jgi:hypothetical protein
MTAHRLERLRPGPAGPPPHFLCPPAPVFDQPRQVLVLLREAAGVGVVQPAQEARSSSVPLRRALATGSGVDRSYAWVRPLRRRSLVVHGPAPRMLRANQDRLERVGDMPVQVITTGLNPKALLARLLAELPTISQERHGSGDGCRLDFEQGVSRVEVRVCRRVEVTIDGSLVRCPLWGRSLILESTVQ